MQTLRMKRDADIEKDRKEMQTLRTKEGIKWRHSEKQRNFQSWIYASWSFINGVLSMLGQQGSYEKKKKLNSQKKN